MTPSFLAQLGITFLVGSLALGLIMLLSEQLGTKIGGIVGGMPSTVAISLLFIGLTQSSTVASETATIVPFIQGVGALLITVFIALGRRGFGLALVASLATWAIASLGVVLLQPSLLISVLGSLTLLAVFYYAVEIRAQVQSQPRTNNRYTLPQLLFRGAFGGAIITLAVFMTKVGGPYLGGMFAAFPAIFVATAILTYWIHGSAFSNAVLKVLVLSGVLNVLVYSVGIHYFAVPYGIVLASLMAYVLSFGSAALLYWFVQRRVA